MVTITNLVVNGDGSADVTYTSSTAGPGNGLHVASFAAFKTQAELVIGDIGDQELLILLLVNWLRRDPNNNPANVIGHSITLTPGSNSGAIVTVV